jgi:molecular chaperone DnaJ
MAKRDYYEILGVPKTADEDTLKKAYRKLAVQYHPDKNPGDKVAEDKFKELAEAYEILSNPDKRAKYDRVGHAAFDGSGGYGGGGFRNAEDIFSQFGNMFEGDNNPFDSFFGGGGSRRSGGGQPQQQRGTNLRIKVKLTLEEVAKGVLKKMKVKKQVGCETCGGSGAKDKNSVTTCGTCKGSGYIRRVQNTFLGQMQTTAPCQDCKGSGSRVTANCPNCRGEGTVYGEETIELQIPAGVAEGIQLSMSGKGNAAPKSGIAGDLIINIEEAPHEHFQRDGMNLVYELFVNFADAAVGAKLEVPTIDGRVKITIPPGTQSGKMLRLQGKGLPSVQSYGTGDQIVHINIWTPKKLNDEEKALLEKLRVMPNFSPNPGKEDKGFFDRMKDFFN